MAVYCQCLFDSGAGVRVKKILTLVLAFGLMVLAHPVLAEPKFSMPKTPTIVPGISFTDAAAQPQSLAQFRGRYVLLTAWASWCKICQGEISGWDTLQRERGNANFAVLPLSFDRGSDIVASTFDYHDAEALNVFVSNSRHNLAALQVKGFPTAIFIGPDGRELWRIEGAMDWSSDAGRAMLDYFLHKAV